MSLKQGLIASIIINVMLMVLIFYVKKDAHQQAKDYVKPIVENANSQLNQAREIQINNSLLWELIMEIQESPDKSLAAVTKMAKDKRIPEQKDEKAFLAIDATTIDGHKARRIGWEKYSFIVIFDEKDNVAKLNVDDLLGKATPVTNAEVDDGGEGDSTAQ